jgi:Cu(I)/Ag(I) efflux system membrane fusion protein
MSEQAEKWRKLRVPAAVLLALVVGFFLRVWLAPPFPDAGHDGHDGHEGAPVMAKDEPAKAQLWTCSMHPEIRLPKPGKCPKCGMDLIPLVDDSGDEGGLRELTVSENAAKLMEIETVPVERRIVTTRVRMVGKITYDETRVSYITAWIPGRLDRLFVDYTGVPVKKGDHMVSLYSPELLSAQEELLQAVKAVQDLKNSKANIVVETAKRTIDASREKLRLWGLTAEQIRGIEERGKPDDHMTIYAPAGGIVVHKNAQQGMYVQTGTRIYTIADLSQVWVSLDAYESDLMWLRYGQRVEFMAEAYPGEVFSGRISFIHPVLDEATRTVKVRVNVPNADGRLKPGMFVRATAEASIASGGHVVDDALAGKWISPMHPEIVKDGPGTCDVCGMPLERAENLGYVDAGTAGAKKPLVIPVSAALRTGTRAVVYVEVPGKEKPTFEGREVVLGPKADGYYLVRRGLSEGERVVTRGNFKLDAELQIRAKPSMMTPAVTGDHAASGELPAVAASQLQDVATAAEAAVQATAGTELASIRSAYASLGEKVEAVASQTLVGHSAMLWHEYRMLLGNDATEGAAVNTLSAAARLGRTTQEHLDAMRTHLGLGDGKQTASSPAVPAEFRKQLAGVVDGYLAVQAALAKDDLAAAKASATEAQDALSKVDMRLLEGEAHMAWMKMANELKPLLEKLAAADGIEPARATFALVSGQIEALIARFGAPEDKLYKAWCPMAFDNRGAAWIQTGDAIRNPYFGSMMLECGEIKEVLK